jgi:chromosome segregation ATPase
MRKPADHLEDRVKHLEESARNYKREIDAAKNRATDFQHHYEVTLEEIEELEEAIRRLRNPT